MSRKYKMLDREGMYFISFATINWIDVFVRQQYFELICESLNYCVKEKGMVIYCYCIMPSHIHLIFSDNHSNPSKLLREFKTFTSKKMRKLIEENMQESKKKWILWMMKRAGTKNSNVEEPHYWKYSSAIDYCGTKGEVNICLV